MTERNIWDCIVHEDPSMDFITLNYHEIGPQELVKILNEYEQTITSKDEEIKKLKKKLNEIRQVVSDI